MKYDPSRIRLSGQIAATYKVKAHQKEVMKRLKEVYAGGGPSVFFGKDGAIAAKPAKKALLFKHVAFFNRLEHGGAQGRRKHQGNQNRQSHGRHNRD